MNWSKANAKVSVEKGKKFIQANYAQSNSEEESKQEPVASDQESETDRNQKID